MEKEFSIMTPIFSKFIFFSRVFSKFIYHLHLVDNQEDLLISMHNNHDKVLEKFQYTKAIGRMG